jgi:hypothetical protein
MRPPHDRAAVLGKTQTACDVRDVRLAATVAKQKKPGGWKVSNGRASGVIGYRLPITLELGLRRSTKSL